MTQEEALIKAIICTHKETCNTAATMDIFAPIIRAMYGPATKDMSKVPLSELRKERESLSLSIEDVHKATGLTKSQISTIERGITKSARAIKKLKDFYATTKAPSLT